MVHTCEAKWLKVQDKHQTCKGEFQLSQPGVTQHIINPQTRPQTMAQVPS